MKLYLRVLNLLAYMAMIYVNYTIGFMGQERSDVLFTPAPYTFSIWVLIYASLLGFVIYQLLPNQRNNCVIENIGLLFVITSFLNIMWLLSWNRGLTFISWLIMLLYFILLGILYISLDQGCSMTLGDRLFIQIPFSLYFAWISVAFIANTAIVLSGLINPVWVAIFGIFLATVFGLLVSSLNHDLVFLLVIIWALVGIFIKNYGMQEMVALVAGLAVLVLVIQGGYLINRKQS